MEHHLAVQGRAHQGFRAGDHLGAGYRDRSQLETGEIGFWTVASFEASFGSPPNAHGAAFFKQMLVTNDVQTLLQHLGASSAQALSDLARVRGSRSTVPHSRLRSNGRKLSKPSWSSRRKCGCQTVAPSRRERHTT